MFVGHGMLAFALVAGAAHYLGHDGRRALTLGAVAGVFATVPDVDMAYALVGVLESGGAGPWRVTDAFWATGSLVHRAVTHSIVVALPAAVGFALWGWSGGRREVPAARALAVAVLGTLVAVAWLVSGPLGGFVMALFAVAGSGVAVAVRRATDLGPGAVLVTALVGLLSHPFGDLFTGEPPHLLYPLDVVVFPGLVLFSPDPTLHLLGAFFVELGTLWLALATYCRVTDRPLPGLVDPRASVGAGYGAVAFALPAPTLEVSYHFVFSVLAVSFIGATPRVRRDALTRAVRDGPRALDPRSVAERPDLLGATVTGLAAVTAAGLGYAAVYLLAVAG